MPENTVEILIRARDEATRVFNQAIANQERASQAVVASSQRVARASELSSRELRAFGTSARFAAVSLVGELSPALGTGVARLTSLASVAALSGSAIGALATVGVGALVIGLGQMIDASKKAKEAQEALNKAMAAGTVEALVKAMADLEVRIEAARGRVARFAEDGSEFAADRARAERELNELLQEQERINQAAFRAGARRLDVEKLKEAEEITKRVGEAAAAWAQAQGDVLAKQMALRELAPFLSREEADVLALAEAYKELGEVTERVDRDRAEMIQRLEHQATEIALGQVEDLNEALEKAREPVLRTMTSLGNAAADALFDSLLGRSRNLAQAVASFFEGFARDIFRNTLAQLFGGRSQGLGLQNLGALFGGGAQSPLGSQAVAAAIPFGGSLFGGQTSIGGIPMAAVAASSVPSPVGGPLIEPPAAAGLTAGQLFGGVAGVGLGILGLVGAARAQDPFSGAISGGLGGLSVGLGLAQLGLGAGAVLGPIGLAVGLAFGVFAGARGRRRKRREEARRRRAAAQIVLLEAADTLEELERLSTIGLEPEAQDTLRQRATPLILEAGRREIAGTASLAGIQAILARGVSPDVGGLELRAEAERRRQEILGGLEEIGGISIDEEVEGGIRRRTIVGAGAFGSARARAAGGDVVIDPIKFRRMLRQTLRSSPELIEDLIREILSVAGARRIRLEPLRL